MPIMPQYMLYIKHGKHVVMTTIFLFCILVLYSFYSLQRGSQGKLYFSKDPEGVQHFPRGVQRFPGGGGVQMLISIETHITCDFSRGSGPPFPPLDPHMTVVAAFTVFSHG